MKKIITLLLALCISASTFAAVELTKKQQKQVDKETKALLKNYTKNNWTIFASTSSLEKALSKHLTKLATLDENGYEVVGTADNFKSKNLGHQTAIHNACVIYAGQAGSDVRGRTVTDIIGNASVTAEEADNFYAVYERNIEREIRSEMKESFSIIRETSPGVYEMQSFFIIDREAASKARAHAAQLAMEEVGIPKEHHEKMKSFVRAAFDR